jgi:hypothetical protein
MKARKNNSSTYLKDPANCAMEAAFRDRDRQRCSKHDFASGFIAALRWLNLYDRYRPEPPVPDFRL